jgi:hypothetical protein
MLSYRLPVLPVETFVRAVNCWLMWWPTFMPPPLNVGRCPPPVEARANA